MNLRFLLFILVGGIPFMSFAQADSIVNEVVWSYQLSLHTGFIFAHSEHVQNTKGARPRGAEFSITWQKNDESTWNLCNCFPQHGLMVAYYDFDNEILGKGIKMAYMLEPWYRLNNRNYLSLKSAVGIAYLSNPYHPVENPTNQSYSTRFSAYLFLGVGWWRRISDTFWMAPHVQYQHTSNGGLRVPNKGINWPTASLTFSYSPKPRTLRPYSRAAWQGEQVTRYDIGIFGIANREGGKPDGKSDRFLLAGVMLQATKQVGRMSNVSAGIEFNYDGVLGSKMDRDSVPGDPVQLGLLAGHEFILGRFLFSQRLGIYLYQAGDYFDLLFHRWGLTYRIHRHWSVGINLKAHRQEADYTDVRIIHSFFRAPRKAQ